MKYDFDQVHDRKNTDSLKWDHLHDRFDASDLLPLWVADMDFPAPQPVIDAVQSRAQQGIYGYTLRSPGYSQAIVDWLHRRHQWAVNPETIVHTPGVVPSIALAIRTFTEPGDHVLIQSPVYPPFFSVIENNQRIVVDNSLVVADDRYVIDFDDLRAKLIAGVKLVVLCSPHNPVGRVWEPTELEQFAKLCLEYNALIVTDEIWSDIIFTGHRHTPIASLGPEIAKQTITCMAPSKTFNIAGLNTSFVVIDNDALRKTFAKSMKSLELELGNLFGIVATKAAYSEGEDWLNQLLAYLEGNLAMTLEFLHDEIPQIKPVIPEGTYLLWLDCGDLMLEPQTLRRRLVHQARVGLNDGPTFGPGGNGFQRINLACPRHVLREGLRRIATALVTIPPIE